MDFDKRSTFVQQCLMSAEEHIIVFHTYFFPSVSHMQRTLSPSIDRVPPAMSILIRILAGWKVVSCKCFFTFIYKTKNRRNKGGLRYVLPVVRFVYLVYSPSSSLPDYQVKQTAPRSFIVIRLVCKGVLYKHRDLRTCKPVHG